MAAFALVLYLVIAPIVIVLMVVQALFSVLSGQSNSNLRRFGSALGQYVFQILQFLTYNSHEKPFPFTDFPSLDEAEDESVTDSATAQAENKDKPAKKSASKKAGSARKKTASKKAAKKAEKKAPSRKSAAVVTSSTGNGDDDKAADIKSGESDNSQGKQ